MKKEINLQLLYTLIGAKYLAVATNNAIPNFCKYPYWKFELLPHYLIQAHQPKQRESLFKIFSTFETGDFGWVYPPIKKESILLISEKLLNAYGVLLTNRDMYINTDIHKKHKEILDPEIVNLVELAAKNIIENKPRFMNYTKADHAVFSMNSATYGYFCSVSGIKVNILESEYRDDFLNEYSPFLPSALP